MRLSYVLTLLLLSMALLVGVLGVLLEGTSEAISSELDALRRSSLEEALGADSMDRALQATLAAAYRLLGERYRERGEFQTHESEWGAIESLDFEAVDEGFEDFERALAQARAAVVASSALGDRIETPTATELSGQQDRLRDLDREYAVHRQLLERLVHLMRYHPTEHVREHLQEQLEPHYDDAIGPLIREFADAARDRLTRHTAAVELLVSRAAKRNRWLTAVAFAFALAFGLLLSRWITRPLAHLRDAALRIGAGELENRVEVGADNEIGELARSFNQMAESLRASTVSRAFLDNILQSMREIVLVVDAHGEIQAANQIADQELAGDGASLIGTPVDTWLQGDGKPLAAGAGEIELRRADGSRFPASFSCSDLGGTGGDEDGFVLVARDITQRREAEETLKRSLHEKEVLLKEVHHRVKNNLQIVCSLLELQEGHTIDPIRGFRESQNRIRSMALIHEHLYQSSDLASIDFDAYLRDLTDNLLASYGSTPSLSASVEVESGPVSLDTAIPCGMIVTELVTNAVEHGFNGQGGAIEISFSQRGDGHVLRVLDDGKGLSVDFDLESSQSLGLRLVSALTGQLHGTLEYGTTDRGTEFCVHFVAPEAPSR